MDIYQRRSNWKIYMAIAGILIMFIVMTYSSYLASNLREGERNKAELFVKAAEALARDLQEDPDKDVTFPFEVVQSNKTIPVIEVDERGNVKDHANFPETFELEDVEDQLEKIKRSGIEPIAFNGPGFQHFIYYRPSRLLTFITYFPLVMLLLLAAFMAFGYLGITANRKAEQNRVWVGMAKETAHQLGTPISAIVAWIEHLKLLSESESDKLDLLDELSNDVKRLELIADRFSKIGSAPKLERKNIFEELCKTKNYMQRRASRKVHFDFPSQNGSPLYLQINSHLFNWVVENLIRNALDAVGGEGEIKARVYEDGEYIGIDISDSGKGIPGSKQKMVFQPGYTTKKRGWGLGLSLAKRIVENYHEGKIFVKNSEPDVGTTFTIKLPREKV
ncbi:MAG: HAMP domain-containing histidine kinase [Saprospiraceae bacterium]|nr:HAMP domain-containing histidine kinase [Saprospiraceae bacterium]